MRSSTSSGVNANAPGSRHRRTSTHVTGVATVGTSRPRTEYGAIVVLAGLFWLQSMKTLPSRRAFVVVAVTSYAGAKARKNYAGTSPITIASGCRSTVTARRIRNTRLTDALMRQAMCALRGSPGARAYYDRQRGRGVPHNAALRHVANRLVGILHGCLATRTTYDETTAWGHRVERAA